MACAWGNKGCAYQSAIYRSCVCLCVPSKSQGANCTSLTQLSHGGGWCRLQTAYPLATSTWTDWGLTYTTAVAHRSTNTAHASPAALEHEGPGRTMMDTTHGSGHARLPRCPQMHDCAKDYTGGFEPPPPSATQPPWPQIPALPLRPHSIGRARRVSPVPGLLARCHLANGRLPDDTPGYSLPRLARGISHTLEGLRVVDVEHPENLRSAALVRGAAVLGHVHTSGLDLGGDAQHAELL